jgi:thiamine biosynthesis protein ThiI
MAKRSKNTNSLKKIIYIKFGELNLKGKNRNEFVRCLYKNILFALSAFKKLTIQLNYDSIVISNISSSKYSNILDIAKNIPGISIVIEAYVIDRNIDTLHQFLLTMLKNENKSFKVFVNRNDKTFLPNSVDFASQIGSIVLNHFPKMHVDVNNPQIKIYIEIKSSLFIVYFNKIKARGGFPLGINGRVLMLISGGIDSPVAA